jgi:hypothetical protein
MHKPHQSILHFIYWWKRAWLNIWSHLTKSHLTRDQCRAEDTWNQVGCNCEEP